jgi:hypothetical protein
MSEEHVAVLSLVMRVHEFRVLHILEALYFGLDDGVGRVGID